VKAQHLVRRVNRQGFVKVDLYPYYLSSKLGFPAGDLIYPGSRAELAAGLSPGVSSLAAAQRLTPTSTALSGVPSTHAARSLHSNLVCLLRGGGKSAQTDRLLHTMQGNFPSDEVGKSYTHPVGTATCQVIYQQDMCYTAVKIASYTNPQSVVE